MRFGEEIRIGMEICVCSEGEIEQKKGHNLEPGERREEQTCLGCVAS